MQTSHSAPTTPDPTCRFLDANAEAAGEDIDVIRERVGDLVRSLEITARHGEKPDPAVKALVADLASAFARFEVAS